MFGGGDRTGGAANASRTPSVWRQGTAPARIGQPAGVRKPGGSADVPACRPWPDGTIFRPMFAVTEADAAAIRAAFEQGGELSAVVELRRRFPSLADNENTLVCARSIARWTPLPVQPVKPRVSRRRASHRA
jgi:hypothetical protein